MYIFRIHIRPGGGLEDPKLSFDYCLNNNLLGVGWQIPKKPDEHIDWDTYEKRSIIEYEGKVPTKVNYIKEWVSKDDLVWTRDTKGQYYLARVLSPWEYYDNPNARDADIVNIFRVELKKVGMIDEVPGKVIASFRGRGTIQEITGQTSILYSKMLWNELCGRNYYQIDKEFTSLWDLLSSEQVEDLLFLYLQTRQWCVVPHSRKKDSMSFEFYLINRDSYDRAVIQVKTGDSPIDMSEYDSYKEKVFLFQPNHLFSGSKKDNNNIIILDKKEIESFIRNNPRLIPENIMKWCRLL